MNVVQEIRRINERELKEGLSGTASWHHKYKDSAWVFVGGLPFELTEGDVLCVMSQWGEIEDLNLVRDPDTGKVKGFAFIKYEDQRSTILAVDNFNGVRILGRTIRVDHVEEYKLPKDVKERDEERMEQAALTGEAPPPMWKPGHAYEGKELASEHNLHKGVDVFAPAEPEKKPKKRKKEKENEKEKKKKKEEKEKEKKKDKEKKEKKKEKKKDKAQENVDSEKADEIEHDAGKHTDRRRSRGRSGERDRPHDRHGFRERDRPRDRDGSRDRGRHRGRGRDRSRDRDGSRDADRGRKRGRRSRSKSRSRSGSRSWGRGAELTRGGEVAADRGTGEMNPSGGGCWGAAGAPAADWRGRAGAAAGGAGRGSRGMGSRGYAAGPGGGRGFGGGERGRGGGAVASTSGSNRDNLSKSMGGMHRKR